MPDSTQDQSESLGVGIGHCVCLCTWECVRTSTHIFKLPLLMEVCGWSAAALCDVLPEARC